MAVPIQIPWDLYQGKIAVWCECLAAGVRRAVLLPRLDPIFAPMEEDPARELPRSQLDWRLVSPSEADWRRYCEMVKKQAQRMQIAGVRNASKMLRAGWAADRSPSRSTIFGCIAIPV